jgi:hypothetical protein
MPTAITLLTLLLKILSLGGRRGRASWWSWSGTGRSLPAPGSLRVVLPLSRSLYPSSGFSLRRRLSSAESMCITRRSDVRVKVRSTRSHVTLERRRSIPVQRKRREPAPEAPPRRGIDVCLRSPRARRWAPGSRMAYSEDVAARTGLSTCSTGPDAGELVANGDPPSRCKEKIRSVRSSRVPGRRERPEYDP